MLILNKAISIAWYGKSDFKCFYSHLMFPQIKVFHTFNHLAVSVGCALGVCVKDTLCGFKMKTLMQTCTLWKGLKKAFKVSKFAF